MYIIIIIVIICLKSETHTKKLYVPLLMSLLYKWKLETQLNSTQLNTTQLNSTQLNSTQLNSTQCCFQIYTFFPNILFLVQS